MFHVFCKGKKIVFNCFAQTDYIQHLDCEVWQSISRKIEFFDFMDYFLGVSLWAFRLRSCPQGRRATGYA
ncbi:MAG: hypothetical protein NZ519_12635, partial [Bacteroidia bacterium]|nr:hypothetical protein [Bacteroidia bacterium]